MTAVEWWTAALIVVIGFIGLYWWTSGDDTPIGDTARSEAIARADAYRMHPSQGDPFAGATICGLHCHDCNDTYYAFPHNGGDFELVYRVEKDAILSALDFHMRTDHGRVAA